MNVETVTKRLQAIGLDITVEQVTNITDSDKVRQFYTVTCEHLIDMLCDFHPNLNNVTALDDMSDEAAVESFIYDLIKEQIGVRLMTFNNNLESQF